MLVAAVCITFGVMFLGYFIELWLTWGVHNVGFIESTTVVIILAFLGGAVVVCVFVLFLLLRSLFKVIF